MNDLSERVSDRRFELELAEAVGREAAPDRAQAILARVGAPPRRRHTGRAAASIALVTMAPVAWIVATSGGDRGAQLVPAIEPAVAVEAAPPAAPYTPPVVANESATRTPSAVHAAGADPADLAAQRSAARMLEVERDFGKRVRDGALTGMPSSTLTVLPFPVISGWNYTHGLEGMPESVRAFDGAEVAMLGFMLPIDEVRGIRRFLLVQSLWSCCYGTPPGVHGIVLVEMAADRTVEFTMDPVAVMGTFRVRERIEDGYVVDIYQLDAQSVVVQ